MNEVTYLVEVGGIQVDSNDSLKDESHKEEI